MPWARVARRHPRRQHGRPPSAATALTAWRRRGPVPDAVPVPTMPGPMAQTIASAPAAAAYASAEYTFTACTSASTHGAAATVNVSSRRCEARAPRRRTRPAEPRRHLHVGDSTPLSAAHTGTTCECREQHTTGIPASDSASATSSPCDTAFCSDVYGSVITWAPGSGSSPRPRVRFTCRTSKPPLPSSSSRACTFTTTSSPTRPAPSSADTRCRRCRRPRAARAGHAARRWR